MRVLVLYAHPVETSFVAALHAVVVETLTKGGHRSTTATSMPRASTRS